jgi:hypothetical protein
MRASTVSLRLSLRTYILYKQKVSRMIIWPPQKSRTYFLMVGSFFFFGSWTSKSSVSAIMSKVIRVSFNFCCFGGRTTLELDGTPRNAKFSFLIILFF